MNICFIRHGESKHNIFHSLYGESAYFNKELEYSPLTENGKNQIYEKSLNFFFDKFEIVLTSSLPRTLETTSILFQNRNPKIFITDLVRENNLKHICNTRKSITEINKEYKFWDTSLLKNENDLLNDPCNDIDFRCKELERILYVHKENGVKDICIVSHNDFIKKYLGLEYKTPIINGGIINITI